MHIFTLHNIEYIWNWMSKQDKSTAKGIHYKVFQNIWLNYALNIKLGLPKWFTWRTKLKNPDCIHSWSDLFWWKAHFGKKNSQTNPNKLGWKVMNARWIDMPSPPSKILPKIQLQFGEIFQHSCRLTKLAILFWSKYVSQISIRYGAEQVVSVCQGFLDHFCGVIIRH